MLRLADHTNTIVMIAITMAILYFVDSAAGVDLKSPDTHRALWVCLRDKPDSDGTPVKWPAWNQLTADPSTDRPIAPSYVERIIRHGIAVRTQSKWLNAISVDATGQQQQWLLDQPFVSAVRPVARMVTPPATTLKRDETSRGKPLASAQDANYGVSFEQLSSIGITVLHGLGFRGSGVRVGVLDSGFNFQDHAAFSQLSVVAAHDFINGDDIVWDEQDQPVTGDETRSGQNGHGTRVLSLLAANAHGQMIGAAPEADYLLAKVEDLGNELPVEEDRWIAGVEWADSLGAQVINSSLGYTRWDDGSGYTYAELDGETAPASIVAGMAVQRGIVVVNAAGNDGDNAWRYVGVPADAEEVITVGSVNVFDLEIVRSSSRGPTADGRIKPDVVAPGGNVVVAQSNGSYSRASGTSLATPLVAGACALLLQINPRWSPREVAQALRQTARDLGAAGPDTAYGWGLVDAAVASGLNMKVPTESAAKLPFPNPLRFSGAGGVVYFPLALSAQDEVAVYIYDLSGGKVAELPGLQLEAGDYSSPERALRWSVSGDLNSGLYIYHMLAGTFSHTGKLALVRTGD